MSNALAISAVTATLRHVLRKGFPLAPDPLANVPVSVLPPDKVDKARGQNAGNQINLFLYQIQRNAAWVNSDLPWRTRPGESAFPPLPLNLWYLLTAYGDGDDADPNKEPFGHHLLGTAMSILHDHPVLSADDIFEATKDILPLSDLDHQIERIRITFQPSSVEEIYRLWTGFATPYRLSVAYEAAVTLIESTRPAKAPLPVLSRGPGDKGPTAAPLPPMLAAASPATPFTAARLGDDIILTGQQLSADSVVARFRHARLPDPIDAPLTTGGAADKATLHLEDDLAKDPGAYDRWAPGAYTVALLVSRAPLPPWPTNEVPLALAPTITVTPNSAAAGDVLTIACIPRLRDGQLVALLFGDGPPLAPTSVSTPADKSQPTTLTFVVPAVKPETYVVRLRVDGVDSLPIALTGGGMAFAPNQKVQVT